MDAVSSAHESFDAIQEGDALALQPRRGEGIPALRMPFDFPVQPGPYLTGMGHVGVFLGAAIEKFKKKLEQCTAVKVGSTTGGKVTIQVNWETDFAGTQVDAILVDSAGGETVIDTWGDGQSGNTFAGDLAAGEIRLHLKAGPAALPVTVGIQ